MRLLFVLQVLFIFVSAHASDNNPMKQIYDLCAEGRHLLTNVNEFDYANHIKALKTSNECFQNALSVTKSLHNINDRNNLIASIEQEIIENCINLGGIYREIGKYTEASSIDKYAFSLMDENDKSLYFSDLAFDYYFENNPDSLKYCLNKRYKGSGIFSSKDDKRVLLLKLLYYYMSGKKNLVDVAIKISNLPCADRFVNNQAFVTAINVAEKEDIEKLPLLIKNYISYIKKDIRKSFAQLGISGRSNFWMAYKGYCDFIISKSVLLREKHPEIARLMYDVSILRKGLLLFSEKDISTEVSESGDSILTTIWQKLSRLRIANLDTTYEYVKLEKQLRSKIHNYDNTSRHLVYGWTDVQLKMKDNDVCVEFIKIGEAKDSKYFALILRNDWIAPKCVEISSEQFITEHMISKNNYIDDNTVSMTLWGKIINEAKLSKGDNLIFSCDGLLHTLAIEYLMSPYSKQRMNVLYNLKRVSNTKELCRKHRSSDEKKYIYLFGGIDFGDDMAHETELSSYRGGKLNYLPSTKKEIDDISNQLIKEGYKTRKFEGQEGSKSNFVELSGKQIKIIHIATHGFHWSELTAKYINLDFLKRDINEEAKIMNRSGLFFANANYSINHTKILNDNGIMTSTEISSIDLNNVDFVILSACKTGKGDVLEDGVYGLQRGFKKAGCNSLLFTLWNVDDEATHLFMDSFYKNLLLGKTKHESLSQAQSYLMNYDSEKYKDPVFWAGFVLLD